MSLDRKFVFKIVLLACSTIPISSACAQFGGGGEDSKPKARTKDGNFESRKIEIAEEPKTVDPATLVYKPLSKKVAVEFASQPISDFVEWLRDDQSITVLVDEAGLSNADILLSDPISAKISDQPLYLLLDRLSTAGLAWYVEDEILRITSSESAAAHFVTVSHNVGKFFDEGFESDNLIEAIYVGTAGESWDENGGQGSIVLLGDVMFIRQEDAIHREVAGVLSALSKHGRRTFINDPAEHELLRQKLQEKISVDFKNTLLTETFAVLSKKIGSEIQIDYRELKSKRARERELITFKLTDQKLVTVLDALLAKIEMTWTLRHGAILITSEQVTNNFLKAAVYDVRDLCRDFLESDGLREALITQADPASWEEYGGAGAIAFAKPGVMVVNHKEELLNQVSQLIENYRTALKVSKVRDRDQVDPKEPVTRFYHMPTVMAADLSLKIKTLAVSDSWKSPQNPNGIGTVLLVASRPSLMELNASTKKQLAEGKAALDGLVIDNSVLVIYQTRENHDEISKLIKNIENQFGGAAGGGMGGGMGGGGFGGGFFTIESRPSGK